MSLKSIASTQGLIWCTAATVGMFGVAAPAHANLITFEDLTNGTVVTNQYAAQDITFSSANGEQILVTTQPAYQSTPPNFICTGTSSIDCTGTVIFSFTTPVDNLQFDAVGNQNAIGTSFAQADIYQNGVLTVSDLNLLVSQGNYLPDHQDLSAYANITEVLIHSNTDPAGTGYDTISFTPVTSGVPEPATWAMMLLGFACLGFAGYRKADRMSSAAA
jgi:hypothetical protein